MSAFSNPNDPFLGSGHQAALRSIARVVHETTTAHDPSWALEGIVEMLERKRVLVLTGAGVSTDSGIPDYRGPNGSLKRHRPMTYQEFMNDPAARHRYWARSFVGWRHVAKAQPNFVHYAIAALEERGFVSGVVTQNVDGLHLDAGTKTLIPLHGDLSMVECLHCGAVEDRVAFDERLESANPGYLERINLDPSAVNPDGDVALSEEHVAAFHMISCLVCGSTELKPNVVYFGESVPKARKQQVKELEEQSTALLVVGSSLAVMSGYKFVLDAEKAERKIGIINGGPGRGDVKATYLWRTQVAPAMQQVLDALSIKLPTS
ncbi:Sir2 family NAD-dependent protein deacetylase [Neomicrococcus aestuarii]|uniref:protein acetyllysine N-acetyltransferase n=1 Tax=Neomicrococcus aestuarii TaxID=556325 RepID=A0A1L2ZQN5_9MICC|nr:Sir2 family NAD-dependent protein deacetylase [Neomicrococcus aestuarii]APF41368.1 NAD-dependent protein deacetylase [Neomicrococcus aestuarii]